MLQLPVRNTELTPFEEVVWPEKRALKNKAAWDRNVALVKMLLSMGKVLKWIDGGKGDMWQHMPHEYYIDGMVVRFLPNWGQWEVGVLRLGKLPTNEEDVKKAIVAVRTIMLFKAVSLV